MKKDKTTLDQNSINLKIQKKLERLSKSKKSFLKSMEKPKTKGVNNEEGD